MFFLLTIESVVLLKNKQTRKGTLTLYFFINIFWGEGGWVSHWKTVYQARPTLALVPVS